MFTGMTVWNCKKLYFQKNLYLSCSIFYWVAIWKLFDPCNFNVDPFPLLGFPQSIVQPSAFLCTALLPLLSDTESETASVVHDHHLSFVPKAEPIALGSRSHVTRESHATRDSVDDAIVEKRTYFVETAPARNGSTNVDLCMGVWIGPR